MVFFATPPVDGAFAEYVAIADDFAHPVPDSVSDDAAALLEPLSVAIWANVKAGTALGSHVLVAGAGPIGLLVAQVAQLRGAAQVVVADPTPRRRAAALDHGATSVLDPRDGDAATRASTWTRSSTAPAPPPAVTSGIRRSAPAAPWCWWAWAPTR